MDIDLNVELKAALRQQALAARGRGGDNDALNRNIAEVLHGHEAAVLSGYWPIRDEADPRPSLAAHQGPICLPVVTGPARPLTFRLWDGVGESLEIGKFDTRHPRPSQPEMLPEVLLVPLAGFDRQGNRLGYGGGFYDRTLEKLRARGPVLAIACAFAVQELEAIPVEATDQPLDYIVTDREIIRISPGV